ncbi:MAG: hypothetical protein AAFQ64_09940 [Pseudomonadota bacterium]
MDIRSTAGPSAFPHQRRASVQKPAPASTSVDQATLRLGTQTAGLNQRLVGVVNASRIAALSGPQYTPLGDRTTRPPDDLADVYRRTQLVITPTPASRLASEPT